MTFRSEMTKEDCIAHMGKLAHQIAQAMNVRAFAKTARDANLIGRLREEYGKTDEEIFTLAAEIFSLAAQSETSCEPFGEEAA